MTFKGIRFEEMAWMVLVFVLVAVPLPCEASLESNPLFKPPRNSHRSINFPNYTLYHTLDTLLEEVKAVVARNPESMRLDTLSATANDGYSANVPTVTVGRNHTLRVLINFGQHARELITSELALRFLRTLGERGDALSQAVIKVIPVENVNGRRRVEAGALCERKNGRGVDTNRNWGVDWGRKEKDYDPAEEYPGTAPFSEPETQIVRDLVAEFRPHVWVNVHSGMEALFMPYDHKKSVPEGRGAQAVRKMLQGASGAWCAGRCVVGSGGESVGYLSHGTATDYVYDVAKVPIALTLEIYGDEKAPNEDCFRMFNPLTSHEVDEVISKWTSIFFSLLEKLPSTLAAFREDPMFAAYENEERKFGRVWQGMDSMSEGLQTQASLQFYLILCALLLVMAWVRCGRCCKRLVVGWVHPSTSLLRT